MEISLTPEQEKLLAELARSTGRESSDLVREAVDRMLDEEQWFRREVQVGIDQIDSGESIGDAAVRARLDRLFPAE